MGRIEGGGFGRIEKEFRGVFGSLVEGEMVGEGE